MDISNFDKQFSRTTRMIYVGWAISAIMSLSILGGLVWVAWHFISKAW